MRWLLVVALAVGLVGFGGSRLDTASGQATLTKVVAPASWPVGGGDFEVRIEIENVANLGAYEWTLTFDPAIIEPKLVDPDGAGPGEPVADVDNSPFLGSTGRDVFCPAPILDEGSVRFGCATTGNEPGPSGSDLLSTVTFSPVAWGSSLLGLGLTQLSDPTGDLDIPSSRAGSCIAIGAGATCVEPTVAPPATTTPVATPAATPGGTDETPIPAPTSTPVGPQPTPTPLPPGFEAVPVVAGCNPVASTYPDVTLIQTLSDAVGPAGNLISLWKFDVGSWRAYSPQYPQASDLADADLLDVLFVCVGGPGDFVRPVI